MNGSGNWRASLSRDAPQRLPGAGRAAAQTFNFDASPGLRMLLELISAPLYEQERRSRGRRGKQGERDLRATKLPSSRADAAIDANEVECVRCKETACVVCCLSATALCLLARPTQDEAKRASSSVGRRRRPRLLQSNPSVARTKIWRRQKTHRPDAPWTHTEHILHHESNQRPPPEPRESQIDVLSCHLLRFIFI